MKKDRTGEDEPIKAPRAVMEGESAGSVVAFTVCCSRTTRKVHGGRVCQVCKRFVANPEEK